MLSQHRRKKVESLAAQRGLKEYGRPGTDYSNIGEKLPWTHICILVAYLMNDSIEQAITTFKQAKEKLAAPVSSGRIISTFR